VIETVGVIGLGKIGLRIADNLIKSGYRVVGCWRHAMTEFVSLGGKAADSPADVGAAADIVFSCLPSAQALDEVFQGPHGVVHSAHAGQVLVERGSCQLSVRNGRSPARREGGSFYRWRDRRNARDGGGAQGRGLRDSLRTPSRNIWQRPI
jgi:3-hydroxyisobutyrate dehydrogenase